MFQFHTHPTTAPAEAFLRAMPRAAHLVVDVGRARSAPIIGCCPSRPPEGAQSAEHVGGSELSGFARSSGRDYASPAVVSEAVR
jgi:hypothetical protein